MAMFRKAAPVQPLGKAPTIRPTGKPGDMLSPTAAAGNNRAVPSLGQVNPSHLLVGAKVWVADPKVLWRIGEVQEVSTELQTAQIYLPDASDDKVQTLSISKLFTFDASHIVDHEDIALMNNMHEAPLLNVLRQRFEADKIYTFTADILLSINPYKTIPLLYDVMGFMDQRNNAASDSTAPPHLFTIAEKAYKGMKGAVPGSGTPQSIIISGESGAGKTEASKYIMKYLAAASKYAMLLGRRGSLSGQPAPPTAASGVSSATNIHEKIEECVVLSNLILESFGNAKTSRNDNSSRFGKYIQIHYNAEGRMVGVSIRHFLLEKTRLVMPQANERNYHIFYQLLSGLRNLEKTLDKQRPLKLVSDVWNYTFLSHGECVEVDGIDDATEFEQLQQCLEQLGMDKQSFQLPMFEILAAILHLGNLQFQSSGQSNDNNEETTTVIFPESARGVDLQHVSMLLGFNPSEFAKKMVTQTTVTGRGSILEIKLTPEQAKNAMDAFCKHLYGELFHHLIGSINACAKEQAASAASGASDATSPKARGKSVASATAFIGILDIFGFEVMQRNSLEQLCINFTNETLQQQFNKHVFVLEQERYANEGIEFSIVEFKDNQPCLDLIQKPPTGLLPLLEEQMLLKRKTTDKQLLTIYHGNHLDKHANYAKPRFECDEFIIRHYAGDVTYDIHEFIAKNTDNLHDDLLDLVRRSSHALLQAMFRPAAGGDARAAPKRPGGPSSGSGSLKRSQGTALTGATTVSSRFRTQLSELMDVLWATTPNYIKCIKPNNLKFPGGFSCELVRDQLVYSGVLEVVRIRQEGFPIRKRFDVFYQLFWPLALSKFTVARTRNDLKATQTACEFIAVEWLEKKSELNANSTKKVFAIGRNEIFLRYGQLERLGSHLAMMRDVNATILQSKFGRARLACRSYQRLRHASIVCQAQWRMHALKMRYRRLRSASVKIQAQIRGFRLRKSYRRQRDAACIIWRVVMRFLTHLDFVRWNVQTKAVVTIQRHLRGYLCRTSAERARKLRERSSLALQCWYRMARWRRVYRRQKMAITRIQTQYRSAKLRREFVKLKQASIVLAAFIRQVLQRKKFKGLKQRVVKFQALARGWKLRHQFMLLKTAVIYVQSKRRQQQARLICIKRLAAVQTLQHAVKGWVVRCNYAKMRRSVRLLHYWARGWLLRKDFRRVRTASRRIQKMWRRYIRRRRWELELASVYRSSNGLVGISWTHHTKMEDSDRRIQHLRQNPTLYFNLQPKAYGYNSLFHHAAACGDLHVVKYMLDNRPSGSEDDLLLLRNGRGHTAFHEACANGQYEIVKLLAGKMKIERESMNSAATNTGPECDTIHENDQQQGENQANSPAGRPLAESTPTPSRVIYSGYLRKRRETSRWMRRYVVLSINGSSCPQLDYYSNDKPQTLKEKSSKTIDLGASLFKKSMDIPFAFEVHSPELLIGHNKEGRLYFAAENELDIQKWLAHLRNNIPSSIESRVFAMHRASKYGKLEFIDFCARKAVCNMFTASGSKETPLHLAASCRINSASPIGGQSAATTEVAGRDNNNSNNNNNNSVSPQDIQLDGGVCENGSPVKAAVGKTKLDFEADVVKTALWLVENGADINATTTNAVTPLQLALRAGNLFVAKHLLDRGALATGLTETEIAEVQRLKAALAKNAISSVGSSNASHSSSGGLANARQLGSSLKLKYKQAVAAVGAGGPTSPSKSTLSIAGEKDLPLLFLLKQPGKIRNSSYVSVFVELVGISNPHYLRRPRIVISVLDAQRHLVEMRQQVSVQPLVVPSSLIWSFTWHMQTPLENLPLGACVVFELAVSPPSTAAAAASSGSSSSGAGSLIPTSSADDFSPVCWTYLQVDQRTANCMALNAEMYKYPLDLTLKRLQRVDAFLTGDVLVSQGPTH